MKKHKAKKKKTRKHAFRRNYRGADSYMIEQSQTLHGLFVMDKAAFVAYDADFGDPFAAGWQALIDDGVHYIDDNTVKAIIEGGTDSVKERLAACRYSYNEIIYYAAKAYGKNATKLREFGKGADYKKAFNSQTRMFGFMDELSEVATKRKADLIAKGCTQPMIDNIATVRDALQTDNVAQNLDIKGRPVISEGRVKAYNAIYAAMRLVLDAAKMAYKTNLAKRGQYSYSPRVTHGVKLDVSVHGLATV